MIDALTYQIMLKEINRNARKEGILNDSIGILITRPELPTGKDILNSLEYYHFRTGKSVNFYLPGYGAYWNSDYPDSKVVTTIDKVNWLFSNQMFALFIEDLEKKYNEDKLKYQQLYELMEKVYLCQDIDSCSYEFIDFSDGFSVDMILKVLKWLFIEQDIRYWNYSGRDMLWKGICSINHN